MTGIIYRYTSPSGKIYIGQTRDEKRRRSTFLNKNKRYCSGGKIDVARKKYGPENFKYEVLETIKSSNVKKLIDELNKLETLYIKRYNSYRMGYNSSLGGDSFDYSNIKRKPQIVTEETKLKISKAKKGKRANYTKEDLERRANLMRSIYSRKVFQYSLDGQFIKEWSSITEVAKTFNVSRTTISDCWNKNKKNACGFIWKRENTPILRDVSKDNVQVAQYDKDGNLLKTFSSIREASVFLNKQADSNIVACCRGRQKTAYGFIWKYI